MEHIGIKVLAFGMIAEKIEATEFYLQHIKTTDEFMEYLTEKYPQLQGMKFTLSLNKNIINKNTAISEGSVVALLPPFSGG